MPRPYLPAKMPPFRQWPAAAPVRVDGLRELAGAEQFVAERAALQEPGWVLIQGSSGSGQTTLAYHLLHHYSAARGIAPADFIVPEMGPALNHNTAGELGTWMGMLRVELLRRNLLSAELRQDFATYLATPAAPAEVDLLALASQVEQRLGQVPAKGFAVLLEQVPNPDVLAAVARVFAYNQTLVVMTVHPVHYKEADWKPYVDNFKGDARALHVPLGPLSEDDLCDLAEGCWAAAAAPPPCPFGRDEARPVFQAVAGQERPVLGRALRILDSLHRVLELRREPAPYPRAKLAEAYELYRDIRQIP